MPIGGIKVTMLGKSYWNKDGAYQKEMDELYEALVPSMGEAETVHGELIRSVSRLFYDFCNNGNCNAIEHECDEDIDYFPCDECDGTGDVEVEIDDEGEDEDTYEDEYELEECPYCGGDGEVEEYVEVDGEAFINEYYLDMINFIRDAFLVNGGNIPSIDALQLFMLRSDIGYGTYTFDENEMDVYNKVVDAVMYLILTTENQKI